MLENDLLLRALRREPVERTPVWLMRQAGRYLPEYRATRAKAGSFMQLCTTPELACEVTLQPLERFALDAAILFSDILTIPDAMGLGLYFSETEGPRFERPITNTTDIAKLAIPDPEQELAYVTNAVRTIKAALAGKVPLIGFAGSPWTLATYMVEGGSSKTFAKVKQLLYQQPAALHQLLEKLAQAVSLYLQAQTAAGAQALMIFDTWGGVLAARKYQEFSLRYMQQIVTQLPESVPVVLFTKAGDQWLEDIAATGCHGVGLDWTSALDAARRRIGSAVALQGNLDPAVLRANPPTIRTEVHKLLESFGHGTGHVFNLGHGVQPDIPAEHVAVMVDAVHEFSPNYHR